MDRSTRARANRWAWSETRRLVRRGGWHARTALILSTLSVLMPRRMRANRLGFLLLQGVDDLCDGDLDATDPIAEVDAIAAEWAAPTERFAGTQLAAGVAVLRATLAADPGGRGADALAAVARLIATMRRDHDRRVDRELWTGAAIDAHLHATFRDSIDLMLIAAGGRAARASDVPSLVDAMCWCSIVRDFEPDLRHGICNVPAEVLAGSEAGAVWQRCGDSGPVLADPAVVAWWFEQHTAARPKIDAARAEIDELRARDRRGAFAVRSFLGSLERWHQRAAAGPR